MARTCGCSLNLSPGRDWKGCAGTFKIYGMTRPNLMQKRHQMLEKEENCEEEREKQQESTGENGSRLTGATAWLSCFACSD